MAATTKRRQDDATAAPSNPIPSSSPAFGTPVHPILDRRTAPIPAPAALKPTILPILLPPATLRPLAFRTFTKKHNLTLTSAALSSLAAFIGRHCGSGWREEGLAERVLEEAAKSWKQCSIQVIVDGDGDGDTLRGILKALEGSMSGGRIVQSKTPALSRTSSFNFGPNPGTSDTGQSRPGLEAQNSFGMSALTVASDGEADEEEEEGDDPRHWIKVIGAFDQPKLVYNVQKKGFESSTIKPSLFPPPSHKTDLFRQRYQLIHQRVLRNESFQTPSFSAEASSLHRSASFATSTNRITPIANLLGRSGSNHLLLALLTILPSGTLALSDLTGTIALDVQHAIQIPEDSAWFTPGMIILVEGVYEEDYGASDASTLGNTGGIGGTIGGKFISFSLAHPPCERRTTTLGIEESNTATGPVFGWTDFLGLGSERATGARMRRIENKLLGPESAHNSNGKIVIAAEVNLDNPTTLTALRTLLLTYATGPVTEFPMTIILIGNFISSATMAGTPNTGSIEYKEIFNDLAAVLADFPDLIARTTFVFVPGDNDAWASVPVPRKSIPDLFTSRVRRVIAEANREVGNSLGKRKEGEVIWATNPSRLCWFGGKGEMVLTKDDLLGRLRRTAIRIKTQKEVENEEDTHEKSNGALEAGMDVDMSTSDKESQLDPDTITARRLTRTILSQSHLSPFPLHTRPVHWDYAHVLNLYPLPTALVLADAEAPPFVVKYEGCCVLNPGKIVEGRRRAKWIEYGVLHGTGRVMMEEM
ncbi:hypothetical protein M501DRAFT_1008707 [Patellaria atrata CBS 101060]|uniref:DNA polymerase epsilon subunit B n=1 Tax=Patellaria atrata CBS 101060 TaxID=1346257 RepID=A0A9P4VMX7_9PEZI|nr:hypothetical protein M501DRAFT_1008707 [Patellaria atrata CBS 101060]